MADKRISQLIERVDIANNDVLPIVASGATTTNKVTISTIQDWMQSNLDVGVTSVGLTMPSAFQVSGSPITTSGNITVTATGTASQYIRGDGTLADFPTGGGGGSSVSYYLNGSVSQGTIGGVSYLEMNKTPVLGAGTDFNISADGYIASFITDAGDPSLLEIPAGNWNFETYFQASSGGGTPSFYIELYKVSGATATLIASNSGNPELIAFGTSTTPYFSALAVPQTTLALTDRLAIRIYVVASGRTITLHTENSNLCQIITTFTTGLTALNGLTAQVQNFATGTSGTDFNISSTGSTHTFNLPTASATNRGALSSADWSTFNAKQPAGNYVTTDTTQSITGEKTFSGSSLRLAANGTADAVVLRNVSGTTGSDTGATTIGFNGYDNIFVNTQSRGGFILGFNNSVSNREYTLPDASGTIALTSNLSSYLPLSGGTLTGALNGTTASFTGNVSSGGIFIGRTTNGQAFGVGNGVDTDLGIFVQTNNILFSNSGASSGYSFAVGGSTRFSISSTGAATFSGTLQAGGEITTGSVSRAFLRQTAGGDAELGCKTGGSTTIFSNGTSALSIATTGAATFSGSVNANATSTFSNAVGVSAIFSNGGSVNNFNSIELRGGTAGTAVNWQISKDNSASNSFELAASTTNGGTTYGSPVFRISSTGAATFSSSVTATANASGRSGFFGGSSFGLRIDNGGSFNNGGTTLHGVDNTFVASYQKLSINGSSLEFMTDYSPRVTITSAGNVGIGTASPSNILHLFKSTFPILTIQSTSYQSSLGIDTNSGLLVLNNESNAALGFNTNNTERMRITSSGDVAIGATSTNGRLGVRGTTNTSSAYAFEAANSSGNSLLLVRNDGNVIVGSTSTSNKLELARSGADWMQVINHANATDQYFISFRYNGTQIGTIIGNNTSVAYNTSSDYRLKENVKPVENALSILTQLKPCTFNFIADSEKEVMGFLAHEVQKIIPQAVSGKKDEVRIEQVELSPAELDEEGNVITEAVIEEKEVPVYQGIDHSKLVPLLVAAIQEQQEQIKSLTEQVEALKSQING